MGGYRLQTELLHGIYIEYDHYTGKLKMKFYDFGLYFDEYKLAINELEGTDVFVSREINGILEENPSCSGSRSLAVS